MRALLLLFVAPLWALPVKDEASMSAIELIRHRGYPAEEHRVTTKDGYILVLHRISGNSKGCPGGRSVLLQHAPLLSSFDFLTPLRNNSLSYYLADSGYDVWLSNSRGNLYSTQHKKYKRTDPRFWNFSIDEMGRYDYPAIINYIMKRSKFRNMYVVGHAQAALTFLIATTTNPGIQKKIGHFYALAPAIGTQSAGANLLKAVSALPADFAATLPLTEPTSPIFFPFCHKPSMKSICAGLVASMGPMDQIDQSRLPIFLSHFPGGTTTKLFHHWKQLATRNTTTAFDYGAAGNKKVYGKPTAPVYDFSGYRVPTCMFYSPEDKLIDTDSFNQALAVVPKQALVHTRPVVGFNHLDFLWGARAKEEVYTRIVVEMDACYTDLDRK